MILAKRDRIISLTKEWCQELARLKKTMTHPRKIVRHMFSVLTARILGTSVSVHVERTWLHQHASLLKLMVCNAVEEDHEDTSYLDTGCNNYMNENRELFFELNELRSHR